MSQKRTIHSFFAPASAPATKRQRNDFPHTGNDKTIAEEPPEYSHHARYPFPIAKLPPSLAAELATLPDRPAKAVDDQPDLDLLYFEPYIPARTARKLFEFLRAELPFYRVEYDIKRGGVETHIRTPRWTTVFGLDETSRFEEESANRAIIDAKTGAKVSDRRYGRYPPRPIPECLDQLRRSTEANTGQGFNFCLVNYYASGADSISFHSDDERFLGTDPAIASFSLGARRDFLMKHKPLAPGAGQAADQSSHSLKLPLASGDMIVMRGKTQANWLHSIPKRTGRNQEDGGRINITFRRAMIKDGTENYYNYNVGSGPVYRWDPASRQMKPWRAAAVKTAERPS